MGRKQGKHEVFVEKQAVRPRFNRLRNLRAKPEKCLQPGEGIDSHAEIDDHKVGI